MNQNERILELEKMKNKDFEALLEIGQLYLEIDEDKAILYLEKSLEINKNIGIGYKSLMTLYNKKRKYYSKEYDANKLQYYLDKIDYMLQLSKDVIRGK